MNENLEKSINDMKDYPITRAGETTNRMFNLGSEQALDRRITSPKFEDKKIGI